MDIAHEMGIEVPFGILQKIKTFKPVSQNEYSWVVNFNLKICNLGARRGGDVHFLIARLYITVLD